VTFEAFMPDQRTARGRTDGGAETSIDWQDNATVLPQLKTRPSARFGVARLPRKAVEDIARKPVSREAVFVERRALEHNPHHGNIVYARGLQARVLKMIANALALEAELA
jgi:hypothetical protein